MTSNKTALCSDPQKTLPWKTRGLGESAGSAARWVGTRPRRGASDALVARRAPRERAGAATPKALAAPAREENPTLFSPKVQLSFGAPHDRVFGTEASPWAQPEPTSLDDALQHAYLTAHTSTASAFT